MSDESKVVFTVPVNITKKHLISFIEVLNQYEIDEAEEELTIEEVLSKPKLLEYLCIGAVEDGTAMYDPFEFWNNDGWCDFKDYR
jgi:hypothetical protein